MAPTSKAAADFRRVAQELAQTEARLETLRVERARAVEVVRAEGMTWKQISEATGLTHQRLNLVRKRA